MFEIAGAITRKICKTPFVHDAYALQQYTSAHSENQQLVDHFMDPVWVDQQMDNRNKFNRADRLQAVCNRLFDSN